MKNIKVLFILFSLSVLPLANAFAKGDKDKQKVVIQTSAICESCQHRIEKALTGLDGVKSASLNLDSKKVTVVFYSSKVSVDQIKQKIAATGYDADDVKANPEALNKLPSCCQPGSTEHK